MKREWQPGDVALVKNEWNVWNVAICTFRPDRPGWWWRYGVAESWSPIVADARSLAVIDFADREQVAVLMGHFSRECGDIFGADGVTFMQAALREFANPTPPKPEEPQGLGAVVETIRGDLFIRDKTTTTVAHWKRARGEDAGARYKYRDLSVVKVHSAGWSS